MSNETVYNKACKTFLPLTLDGYNFTLFAFGQTGSGKTFTMLGSESVDSIRHKRRRSASPCRNLNCKVKIQYKGLSLMFIEELMEKTRDLKDFRINCSYFEIYNENVFDLLDVQESLNVSEDPIKGFFIRNLTEKQVNSFEEAFEMISQAEINRKFSSTEQNSHSSRSHVVLRLVIVNSFDNYSFESVVNFVDLAGSERLNSKKIQNAESINEGKHINTSLFYLCSVILKLSDKQAQGAHIPYRNSNLTKILRNSLGGNSFTSIICTASPAASAFDMTLSTMTFAESAKRVTNKVAQNVKTSSQTDLIKLLQNEVNSLKSSLISFKNISFKENFEKSTQTENIEINNSSDLNLKNLQLEEILEKSLLKLTQVETEKENLKNSLFEVYSEKSKILKSNRSFERKIAGLEEKIKDLQSKNDIIECRSLNKLKYEEIESLEKFFNKSIDLAKDFKIHKFKSQIEERKVESTKKLRKVLQPILIDKENIN